MQLSPHFKLAEFTRSATAQARHIDNTPNEGQIKNLKFHNNNLSVILMYLYFLNLIIVFLFVFYFHDIIAEP